MKKLLVFITLFIFSCNETEFKELGKLEVVTTQSMKVEFCEPDASIVAGLTYYIFVLDDSRSNTLSDPEGERRLLNMYDFINDKEESEDKLAIILFADEPSLKVPFLPVADFEREIDTKLLNNDGFSRALQALEFTRDTIAEFAELNDLRYAKEGFSVNFQIFFATDGVPVDSNGDLQNYQEFVDLIKGSNFYTNNGINDLVTAHPSVQDIKLHTAYYPLNDGSNDARDFMKEMAKAGDGHFLEFGEGENIRYDQFQTPKAKIKRELIEMYVVSKNLQWTKDGALLHDSDADGIVDIEEEKLGSNPNSKDTDNDGVSDLVALRALGHPCENGDCSKIQEQVNAFCSTFLDFDDLIKVPDTENDGLNNCDETILSSSVKSPDSNNNFIDDFREYVLGLNPIQENLLITDSDGDGLSDREEITRGLPIKTHNDQIETDDQFEEIKYKVKPYQNTKINKKCYEIEIDNIPGISDTDLIEVNLVFSDTMLLNHSYFFRTEIPFKDIQSRTYNNSDFKEVFSLP